MWTFLNVLVLLEDSIFKRLIVNLYAFFELFLIVISVFDFEIWHLSMEFNYCIISKFAISFVECLLCIFLLVCDSSWAEQLQRVLITTCCSLKNRDDFMYSKSFFFFLLDILICIFLVFIFFKILK